MIIFSKLLIAISLVGLLRCSESFRTASREFDEQAIVALKKIVHATEESGIPSMTIPLMILLTALCFMYLQFSQVNLH